MLKLPRNKDEWIVATASAFAGFFFGGAAIAGVQKFLKRYLHVG